MLEILSQIDSSAGRRTTRRLFELVDAKTLRPDMPLPSERELADLLEVSRPTLRQVLRQLEDYELIRGEGRKRYLADRSAWTSGSDQTAGAGWSLLADAIVVVGRSPTGKDGGAPPPYSTSFVEHAAIKAARVHGYHTLAIELARLGVGDAAGLANQKPLGMVIAADGPYAQQSSLSELLAMDVPLVYYGHPGESPKVRTIYADQHRGGRELTRWLIGKGCRRILPFCCHRRPLDEPRPWLDDRLKGYREACREHDVTAVEPVRFQFASDPEQQPGGYRECVRQAVGYLAEHLLADEPIDAVLAPDDVLAAVIAEACQVLGRQPGKDVLIAGYDNSWRGLSHAKDFTLAPAVTMDKQTGVIGSLLVDTLLSQVRGEPGAAKAVMVPPRLVVPSPHAPETHHD